MEKLISNFDISSKIAKGNQKQLVVCPNCKEKNIVNTSVKFTYMKINTICCTKCKHTIRIGDIFNFKTGTKLNNMNTRYNQKILDDYIWNNDYDNIRED